jgi:putative DNA methylase
MVWDFLEIFPISSSVGNFSNHVDWVANCLNGISADGLVKVSQADARNIIVKGAVVSTDPPYYDNVGYADLSDFFYVWLRRSLRDSCPGLMSTLLTPKADELVADPFRHGGEEQAERCFEDGFEKVFMRIREGTPDGFPITVFYAFKQAETDRDGSHASTGWETLLQGMLKTG